LPESLQYCLIVQNPLPNSQKVGVTFSGKTTVFGDGGFTSPTDSKGETGANASP